jgi:23S rRNA pseudouridine1911/1915/1917 synthase
LSDRTLEFSFDQPAPERLDRFLVSRLPEFSRSRLQGLIQDGFVAVNAVPARKSGQMLAPGQHVVVRVPPAAPARPLAENIPLDVVYEDADLIVINKPAGMVVHPAAGHASGTLVNAVLAHDPDLEGVGGEERPGVVHRLDKDTSGLILVAKNDRTHRWLQEQFRQRVVEKTYVALVDGRPPTPSGRVEAPIGRDPGQRKKMSVRPAGKGREAVSEYKTLEHFSAHTLLEFRPLSGRTHQIRLHCAFLGCPIVGDRTYGRSQPTLPLDRHFLHAARLRVVLPGGGEPREFDAPLPPELVHVLDGLRA